MKESSRRLKISTTDQAAWITASLNNWQNPAYDYDCEIELCAKFQSDELFLSFAWKIKKFFLISFLDWASSTPKLFQC